MWTTDVLIWSLISFALGIGITLLVQFIRKNNVAVRWYEWVIGVIGLSLLLFTLQNFFTAFGEFTAKAGWIFLATTGVASLILLAVAFQLPNMRYRVK